MKKKSKRKNLPAPVEGLDADERELFLKAFFTGELEKLKPEIKPEVAGQPQAPKDEPVLERLCEDERALFLQAVNTGIVGVTSLTPSPKTSVRIIRGKKRKFADGSIDLHGMVEQDAVRALLDFIKQEKVRGSKTLLVVHGKGTGILRNAVWAVLERHPMVNDFKVAPSRFGGEGALIVRINRKGGGVLGKINGFV